MSRTTGQGVRDATPKDNLGGAHITGKQRFIIIRLVPRAGSQGHWKISFCKPQKSLTKKCFCKRRLSFKQLSI